jgi:RHS repeat-associated protein
VKKVKPDNSKTIYVGGIYEVDKTSGGSVTRTVTYYPAAGAMRINSTLYYTLKDHLGSASVITDASGNILGEQRYYPYGETRVTTGTIFTDKLFTGQREMAGLGIYHYGARFYSPKLGRFLSPDTIVPGAANPQAFNRYSYVLNNPLRYTDPSGHAQCQTQEDCEDMGTTPMGTGGSGGGGGDGGRDGCRHNDPDCRGNNGGQGNGGALKAGGSGGGGHPLYSPAPNADYYQLIANSLYSTPLLPPSPCGWIDCLLAAASILASGISTAAMGEPRITGAMFILDAAVTVPAMIRTENDFDQGEISNPRRLILHITAGAGLIPGPWGFGLSIINGMATGSGYPP